MSHPRDVRDVGSPVAALLTRAGQLRDTGDLSGALAASTEAVRVAGAQSSGARALALLAQARLRREAGVSAGSEQALAAVQTLMDELPPQDRPAVAVQLWIEQGIWAKEAGDLGQAKQLFERAVAGAEQIPDALASALANLGDVFLHRGRMDEARRHLERAVRVSADANDRRGEAAGLNLLGIALRGAGDPDGAIDHWWSAIRMALAEGLPRQATDAFTNLLVHSREIPDADVHALLRRVLDWYASSALHDEALLVGGVVANRLARDGDPGAARDLLAEIRDEHLRGGRVVPAVYDLLNLTNLEITCGDYGAAADHAQLLVEDVERLGLLELLHPAYLALAQTHLGRMAGAEPVDVTGVFRDAHAAYARAAEGIDLVRAGVDRPERREPLLGDRERFFDEAIQFYALASDALPDRAFGQDAFLMSERSRARSFLELLGADRLARATHGDPLVRRRTELTQQLLRASGREPERVARLTADLRTVRGQLAREAPALAALTEQGPAGVDDICSAIPADAALIHYHVTADARTLWTFVLTAEGIAASFEQDLSGIDLHGLIRRFLAEVGVRSSPGRRGDEARQRRDVLQERIRQESGDSVLPTGQELSELLLPPELQELIGAAVTHLLIAPHRSLHGLPFSALRHLDGDRGTWLSDRFDLSVLPSSSFLPVCSSLSRPAPRPGSAVVLGNPTADLPGAEAEALRVADRLGTVPLIGGQATRQALLSVPPGTAVVHVASHGAYDDADPLLSGVQMADGRVTVEDLMDGSVATGLLALSGCVTGLSRRRPGDELTGLTRAAVTAGTASVLATLWEIDDRSAPVFFDSFYADLMTGRPKDSAVAAAQRHMREAGFTSPYHWAPFVLMGDRR
ncbi:CHAT domain-containing protein [Geodermatophilus sp. SYSU D01062]